MTENPTIPLAKLPLGQTHRVSWAPAAAQMRKLADNLDLIDLRKLRAEVTLSPRGDTDWHMSVGWGATVIQPCVVSLAPVKTRLEETNALTFTANMPQIDESEAEMPEDDGLEPLPEVIDLNDVLREMISLALPAYPRAEAAQLDATVFGPPGIAPMTDEDAKPFAGLAALKDKLDGQD
ncbi:MAG: DUF177 domain-containing protein [Pseudomonadota bacterium]